MSWKFTHPPARVDNVESYWTRPPPDPSRKCVWWQHRIRLGWRPNRRIRSLGYYSAAEFYGVYIWEYLNVICPLLVEVELAA